MGDISPHFSKSEFACEGQPVPDNLLPNLRLLVFGVLEPVRLEAKRVLGDYYGLHIESGWRTFAHNLAVGGEPGSSHLDALAADTCLLPLKAGDPLPDPTGQTLWGIVYGMWVDGRLPALGGLGRYDRRSHLDTRLHVPGVLAQWDNRTTGQRG